MKKRLFPVCILCSVIIVSVFFLYYFLFQVNKGSNPNTDEDYNYNKVVLLESIENGKAICREIISRDENNNKVLGDTVIVIATGYGYADYVVGIEYRVIGNIVDYQPLTVLVPIADLFWPLI